MRIRFVKPYGKKEGQGAGPHYAVGQEYDFKGQTPEGYARSYIARGVAVEVDEAAARRAAADDRARQETERKQRLATERAAIVIPEKYAEMSFADLQPIAAKLTEGPIKGKQDAVAAIDAEVKRRAGG